MQTVTEIKSILPDEGLFLIDTNIFSISSKEENHIREIGRDKYFQSNLELMVNLNKVLKSKTNWFTVPEVYKEICNAENYLLDLKERVDAPYRVNHGSKKFYSKTGKKHRNYIKRKNRKEEIHQIRTVLKKLLSQREKTKKIVLGHVCNPQEDFTDEQLEIYETTLPKTQEIHKSIGENPHELNTDCKLISTALAYGITGEPISIYTRDAGLSTTYAQYVMKNHPELAEETFSIVHKKFGNISIEDYYRYNTDKLTKPIHKNLKLITSPQITYTPSPKSQDTPALQTLQL